MSFSRSFFVGTLASALLLAPAKEASALIAVGGGIYCQGLWVNGIYEGLGACYDFGSGGGGIGGGGDPGGAPGGGAGGGGNGSGGSGSTPDVDYVDRRISGTLECAMSAYAHKDVKLGVGRSMKRVNGWAFGIKNSYGEWGYRVFPTNTPPEGPGWVAVSGITTPNTAYGRLYNQAFIGGNYNLAGARPGVASNALNGTLTAFEKSLYAAVHEASHLGGNLSNEQVADWYGIDAVLRYRRDGGAKCAKDTEPSPK